MRRIFPSRGLFIIAAIAGSLAAAPADADPSEAPSEQQPPKPKRIADKGAKTENVKAEAPKGEAPRTEAPVEGDDAAVTRSEGTTSPAAQGETAPVQQQQQPVTHLDDVVARTLPNGCRFSAMVKGKVSPAKADGKRKYRPGEVDPELAIETSVTCPRVAPVRVTETVTRAAPLTWKELETAIERRAAVFIESGGARCIVVPDLDLSARGIMLTHVAQLCPTETRVVAK